MKKFLLPVAIFGLSLLPHETTVPAQSEDGYIDVHMHLAGWENRGRGPGGQGPGRLRRRPGPGRRGAGTSSASGGESGYAQAAASLISLMDRYGVVQSVLVVVPSHATGSREEDYQNVRSAVQLYPKRLAMVAGGAQLGRMLQEVSPGGVTPTIRKQFEAKARQLIEEGAVGFGKMISFHLCMAESHSFQVAMPDHPLYLLLADIAAAYGVPIDLHMEAIDRPKQTPRNLRTACSKNPDSLPSTVGALERLLSHNRKANIVWQHIGWDNAGDMPPELMRRLLTQYENLFLALRIEERLNQVGGGGPMPNRIVDENWRIQDGWYRLIEDFPTRFMIGSDEFVPYPGSSRRWPQSFEETWVVLKQLPKALAEQVGKKNAARIYRLQASG